ncbi:putative bifunctional diguanylate cyclase/phosphodiesterase [Marinobacter sp.]|uniref:putative bifunctional diguanylate cyclase/phosphodiesterase n=1 Tax=Marinobacter sp. TaxID=50741 RepID=UPI003569A65F
MDLPAEDHFRALVESHPRAMMLATDEPRIIYVNRMFESITGYREAEVIGEKPAVLSAGFHGPAFYRDMWASLAEDGRWEGVIWNRRKNGETYPQWLMIHRVGQPDQTFYAGMFMDIGALTSFEERLASMAYYDALTELPNRTLFLELLEMRVSRSRDHDDPFGLLFLDLDYFKDINDLFGHSVGDELLRQVSLCIQGVVRKDDVVARLSGDEFAAIVELAPGVPQEPQIRQLAIRLLNAFRAPFLAGGNEHFISVSVGGVLCPVDGASALDLLQKADKAMYLAKQEGRGRFCHYQAELLNDQDEGQRLMKALVTSLKTAPREFSVVYQPQFDLATGRVDGLEALIRWTHPEFGPVSPARFVAMAESRGMIHQLTEHLVRCILRDLWSLEKPPEPGLRFAINVSARQITDARLDGLLTPLFEQIRRLGWEPELEITETHLMNLSEEAFERLRSLRDEGVRIAIDDFGTGYSSLAYLHSLPVQTIKIDRHFVSCLEDTLPVEDRDRVISAILALADVFGLEAIAEGIETLQQKNALLALACKRGQGYFLARPQPWSSDLLTLNQQR